MAPGLAHADAIDACVSAATSGQVLQRQGKLRDARRDFLTCAVVRCPPVVKTVCDRLLSAVEASLPTVILGAHDAFGQDLLDVRVLLDGAPLVDTLDGKAVPIDPGPHELRFERRQGGTIPLNVVIREAEKNRAVDVSFPSDVVVPPPSPPVGTRRPVLAYILGGLGIASLGAFAVLAIDGQSRFDRCKPSACTQGTIDGLTVQRDVAFATLGLGVVSSGLATWLFLARPSPPRGQLSLPVRLTFGASSTGALLRAEGSF